PDVSPAGAAPSPREEPPPPSSRPLGEPVLGSPIIAIDLKPPVLRIVDIGGGTMDQHSLSVGGSTTDQHSLSVGGSTTDQHSLSVGGGTTDQHSPPVGEPPHE